MMALNEVLHFCRSLQDGNGEYSYMLLLTTPALNAETALACKSYVCSFPDLAI